MAATRGTSANARKVWMRIGTPASSRNCLGAMDGEWPAVIRVPRPAAGRITNTRINRGVYQLSGGWQSDEAFEDKTVVFGSLCPGDGDFQLLVGPNQGRVRRSLGDDATDLGQGDNGVLRGG